MCNPSTSELHDDSDSTQNTAPLYSDLPPCYDEAIGYTNLDKTNNDAEDDVLPPIYEDAVIGK